jgi:hypothetical protein
VRGALSSKPGSRPLAALLLLVLGPSAPLGAQSVVVHEFVPEVQPDEAAELLGPVSVGGAEDGFGAELPPAAEGDQEPAPALTAASGDGHAQEEPGRRSPSFSPDRLTELEGQLDYYDNFTPSIAPFKRMTSLDSSVFGEDGVTPVLGVGSPALHELPIESPDAPAPDPRPRDRFWGEVTLDFSAGRRLPLPSVSPESRLLGVKTEPSTPLRFVRDGADNHFVQLVDAVPNGTIKLTFLTDAPRGYFGMPLPAIPADLLADEVLPLPQPLSERALGFARSLGVARGQPLDHTLGALVAHFRAFEESRQPPPDTGDIYLDLARARRGVCRHRAYAFVVTAHALGIPARFIQNEAHSFVEVKLPDRGWLRIDLGGAAHGLTAHGISERPAYQPVEPDRLPRPAAYEASYSQARANAQGGQPPTPEALRGRWLPPAADSASATGSGPSILGGPGQPAAGAPPQGTDGAAPAGPAREPLTVHLERASGSVVRGSELALEGRVQDLSGVGLPGMRVEVSVAATGRGERMLLGVTVSGPGGRFSGRFGVPGDLSAGDYELMVIAPGDARHLPGVAH